MKLRRDGRLTWMWEELEGREGMNIIKIHCNVLRILKKKNKNIMVKISCI